MDIIYIHGLRAKTTIGVHDWERNIRQTVLVDLEMAAEADKAAAADWIGHTVDYSKISSRVISFIEDSKYKLLETLAEQIAKIVMREFGVPWLHLRLSKVGAVPEAEAVGVIIERGELP
jgi:dihydroneopterin aldolase